MAPYHYIAEVPSSDIAAGYSDAIVNDCESLHTFPHRTTVRDNVRPGLRITNYKKRAVIAFSVDTEQLSIIGIFCVGQDDETILHVESDDGPEH